MPIFVTSAGSQQLYTDVTRGLVLTYLVTSLSRAGNVQVQTPAKLSFVRAGFGTCGVSHVHRYTVGSPGICLFGESQQEQSNAQQGILGMRFI